MKHAPVLITAKMRRVIRLAIGEVCDTRGWLLHALNIRTNHVHAVASFRSAKAMKGMGDFKAYSTRDLRATKLIGGETKMWTAGGSARPIFDDDGLWRAVDYVENEQGPDLPEE